MADVLIIDDDIDACAVLADIICAQGHDTRVGHNGLDGLRLARERTPDVAILDVQMPLLDGPSVAYEMSMHGMGLETVPIILLSACADLEAIATQVGTSYFLAKPYDHRAVVDLVARALTERVAPNPRARQWY